MRLIFRVRIVLMSLAVLIMADFFLVSVLAQPCNELNVIDINGVEIGNVMGFQTVPLPPVAAQFPIVVRREAGRLFPLVVLQDRFAGNVPLAFESSDCSGTQRFLLDNSVFPAGSFPGLFPPVAVEPPGSTVYLPLPNIMSQTITVQSIRLGGQCIPGQANLAQVFPAQEITDLDILFRPPFSVQCIAP